jgi:hypothetical protein
VSACDTGAGATGSPTATTTSRKSTSDSAENPPCAETQEWTTDDTQAEPMSTDALHRVRTGQHDCYDRVVLDIDGPADVGYVVGYVPAVTADGSGKEIPVEGDAALQVIVRAPAVAELAGTGDQP